MKDMVAGRLTADEIKAFRNIKDAYVEKYKRQHYKNSFKVFQSITKTKP